MENEEITDQEIEKADRHAEKMAKKKAARNKIMATKTKTGGLIIVHTGKGKGKSTAAFGMVCRAIGHGMKVGVIQFVKGKWETGEKKILEAFILWARASLGTRKISKGMLQQRMPLGNKRNL